MNIDKLMQKKISRKDFIKSIGFILLTLIFFPKNALSFMDDSIQEKPENMTGNVTIKGIKVIELIED